MSQTHSHSATAVDNYQLEIGRWNTGRNVLAFAALLGIIGCIAGYFTNPAQAVSVLYGGVLHTRRSSAWVRSSSSWCSF